MILNGKTAIITGASRGIGKAIAQRFFKEGANIIAVARDEIALAKLANEMRDKICLNKIIVWPCDVSWEEEVKSLFDAIILNGQKIDILVNAAGIAEPYAPIFYAEFSEWKKVFETNVFGTFLMMRHAIPIMIGNGYGKIINFTGKDGPIPGFSAYNSSKTALVRLTETAAKEVCNFGIDINIISPGPVKTKLFMDMFLESGETPPKTVDIEKTVELALFLASEKSNGLSGKFLSAVWDNWQKIPRNLYAIMNSDAFTLRRKKVEF